jgi:hypothetical protein
MHRRTSFGLITAFLFATVVLARAAGVELTAGVAAADITPDTRMLNWTLPQARPYGEVHDPLFARAVVLADGETRVALLAWDLLDAREFAVARIRTAINQATGIPSAHILISATHNHSGPKSEMGTSRASAREERTSRPAQREAVYQQWADKLVDTCVDLVRRADAGRQPVTLTLGRAYVGEWLFNRRPVRPDGRVAGAANPRDPYALGDGLRFGAVDPTMTVLGLQAGGGTVATLFHLPAHAVSVYGGYKGISADWPGPTVNRIRAALGGEALFLQGCAGDVVPARRGLEAVERMAELISQRAVAARKVAVALPPARLRVAQAVIGLPATPAAASDMQRRTIDSEVQVISCGELALVTLPGEPLQDLAHAIQARSKFPHTLVLGYANGRGVGYVGLPGNKVKGGYEMSEVGHGTDEAGGFLVATAIRLLDELAGSAPGATK